MLAAAAAVSSNSANRDRHPVPNWCAMILCTVSAGIGGAAFCSLVNASR